MKEFFEGLWFLPMVHYWAFPLAVPLQIIVILMFLIIEGFMHFARFIGAFRETK